MKHPICAIGGAALLVAVGAASPAHAEICTQNKQNQTIEVGPYMVQTNAYNENKQQCIEVIGQAGDQGPGFTITKQTGSAPTNGAPVSYPSIYIGCHYNNCSSGTNLPIQLKSIKKAETSIDLKYVDDATFDASYDIWLDPTARKDGVNKQEIMIWLNKQGKIQPVGSPVGIVKIAGQDWQVWSGSNGKNDVISYEVQCPAGPCRITKMTFDVMDFVADASKRVNIDDFYLTSIQAGFEPWQGGQGLAIERFRATVDAH
jgi:hypothetical protein